MKILREVYLRNESHLPEYGWLQSCWTCDTITSRTIEYKKITEGKKIYKFIVKSNLKNLKKSNKKSKLIKNYIAFST